MPKTWREKFLNRLVSRRVKLLVFLTENLKRIFLESFPQSAEQKTIVAHDGVDLQIFDVALEKTEARKKYSLPADKKILGYFGRFKTMGMDKGLNDILRALKDLPSDVLLLAMGGKQRDRAEYSKLAESLGVSDRVIFVEQFGQEILAEYQKAVDVLLMPFPKTEHFSYYMSPLKMFEYMATRRPIVATDLPSIREVLDETTAVIVPAGNPEKLATAIDSLLENPTIGERLTLNAYDKVKSYTWSKRVAMIIKQLQ